MDYHDASTLIINLKNADLELRDRLIALGRLSEGYNEEMEKLHLKNARVLDEIIDKIGYPTMDKVGKEASDAAWLIIQHSISNPDFMKKSLALLVLAVDEKRADPVNLAYLSDRVAVFEDKPQLYGTQFDWDETGQLNPNTFDSLEKVNRRRKEIGLNSMEEQILMMRNRVKSENQLPPQDYEDRKMKFNEWRKAVGWFKNEL